MPKKPKRAMDRFTGQEGPRCTLLNMAVLVTMAMLPIMAMVGRMTRG